MLSLLHRSEHPDYAELAANSVFSRSELKQMYRRFVNIGYCPDPSNPLSVWLSKEAFMQQTEVVFCPLAGRAFDVEMEECKSNGYIDFSKYVRIFSHFSPKATPEAKKMCKYCSNLVRYNLVMISCTCDATIDLKKLLGETDGSLPTKETYVKYIMGLSSNSVMPHVAEQMSRDVWQNLEESFAGKPFAPSAPYDIDILMTIPL